MRPSPLEMQSARGRLPTEPDPLHPGMVGEPEAPFPGGREARGLPLSRAWRALRTGAAFSLFGLGAALLAMTAMPLAHAFSRKRDLGERRAQRIVHGGCRFFVGALAVLRVARFRAEGAERLLVPGTLVVANHPTLLDAVLLLSLMPQADFVVKRGIFENRFLRRAARAAGYLPNDGGVAIVRACSERLARGRSLVIFPEGTRSPASGLGAFQRGAAHIALESRRAPLPVTLGCEPATLKKGQPWWVVPDRRVEFTALVGAPVELDPADAALPRPRAARALTRALAETLSQETSRGRS